MGNKEWEGYKADLVTIGPCMIFLYKCIGERGRVKMKRIGSLLAGYEIDPVLQGSWRMYIYLYILKKRKTKVSWPKTGEVVGEKNVIWTRASQVGEEKVIWLEREAVKSKQRLRRDGLPQRYILNLSSTRPVSEVLPYLPT